MDQQQDQQQNNLPKSIFGPGKVNKDEPLWHKEDILQAISKGIGQSSPRDMYQSIDQETRQGVPQIALSSAGESHWSAKGLSINTRTLKPGDLFIPLSGHHVDGQDFIPQAFQKGAAAALITQHRWDHDSALQQLGENCPMVICPNPYQALVDMARYRRAQVATRFMAVTGSVGKTTVKEGLAHVLSLQSRTFASQGNYNNDIGLPLSLACVPLRTRWGIMEMGVSHPGDMEKLVTLVKPQVSLLTTVSYQHGVNFQNLQHIAREKSEVFYPGALGIINGDAPYFQYIQNCVKERGASNPWLTFGKNPNNDLILEDVRTDLTHSRGATPWSHVTLQLYIKPMAQRFYASIPYFGQHWVYNAVAILAGVYAMGGNLERAAQALGTFYPLPGRGAYEQVNGIHMIDDSYNAAPVAMEAGLRSFAMTAAGTSGKKYVVLGDMKELGQDSHTYHKALLPLIRDIQPHGVWLVGPEMAKLAPHLPGAFVGLDIEPLILPIYNTLREGDWIFIKGANATNTHFLVRALKAGVV